jgi:GntR family transcriptional regulator
MSPIDKLISPKQQKSLDPNSHTPLYHQLYSLFKKVILNGTLPHGAFMPTEQQLSDAFNVSRITSKRAMDELAAEKLVERRRGKGTHVIFKYTPGSVKAPLVGLLQEIESMARQTKVRVLSVDILNPPEDIREKLALEPNETAIKIVRVRSRDGVPFGYYVSWTVGLDKKPSIQKLESIPRLEIFREKGLNFTHMKQTLTACAADEVLAESLDTDVGEPLLSMIRQSFDSDEKQLDYMQVYYHPERFQFEMDLTIDENS